MDESWFPAGGQAGWRDRWGNPVIASHLWTGRPPWAGSPAEMFARALRIALYPGYECEGCVGQDPQHGCYCAYNGAVAPCTPPGTLMEVARRIAGRWFGVTG